MARWDAYLQVYTEHLGEGKLPDGTYLNDVPGVRGIAARCALAKLNARGRDPSRPSTTGGGAEPYLCALDPDWPLPDAFPIGLLLLLPPAIVP